ncbi:MAG: glycosyltransferase family 9 protein [Deltaproteobacteria bacterium]|nr:glycosyltransferase family 9 protein [Deltaproteobacteria bacterium]
MVYFFRYLVFFLRTSLLSAGSLLQSWLHILYESRYPVKRNMAEGNLNILIIQLGQIGDFVLSAPLFAALKDTCGKKPSLTVMTDSVNRDLARTDPNIDRAVFYDSAKYSRMKKGVKKNGNGNEAGKRGGLMSPEGIGVEDSAGSGFPKKLLKAEGFDKVIWLRGDMKAFLWVVINRLPMESVMKFPNPLRTSWIALITGSPVKKNFRHFLECLDEMGNGALPSSLFRKNPRGEPACGQREVFIHIGSGNILRRWPEESFSRLCSLILGLDPDIRVSLIGSKEDREAARRIAQGAFIPAPDRVRNMCGILKLTDLFDRFKGAHLYIGFDSGPMHIAASSGVPIVALMGPQSPQVFRPWADEARIIYKDFFCSPCWQFGCVHTGRGAGACVLAIKPEEVFKEAKSVLEKAFSYAN